MSKALKLFALLLVITVLVWLAMMWRWSVQGADPNNTELVMCLVAAPVALTIGMAICLWQVKKLRAFVAAPIVAPHPTRVATATAEAAAQQTPVFHLLSIDCQSRIGLKWEAAQKSTEAGDHAVRLHDRLVDRLGMPAFVAEMPDLEIDDALASWEALVAHMVEAKNETDTTIDLSRPPDDLLRTLALLSSAILIVRADLSAQWAVLALGLRQLGAWPRPEARVCLEIAIPARWPAAWQRALNQWVRLQLAPSIDEALKVAGQSASMAHTPHAVIQCQVHPVEQAYAFWGELDQRLQRWVDESVPGLMWVIAADSQLHQPLLNELDAQQCLMTARCANGRVPGEAAAALLLASPAWMASAGFPGTDSLATVHPVRSRPREAAQKPKRAAYDDSLPQLAQEAIQALGLTPEAVGHLTSDADHRTSLQLELHEVVTQFPQLDASEGVLCSGIGCGDTGIAHWLLSVALAAERVQASGSPGLVLGHFDERQRLVLLLTPREPAHLHTPVAETV